MDAADTENSTLTMADSMLRLWVMFMGESP
jgi:hypothetical protein